jgi:HEAT repeat protein
MRTLLILGWAMVLLAAPGGAEPPPQTAVAVAAKRRHLAHVVEELSRRDVSDLPAEQRVRRAAALHMLEEYAARGVFTCNTELPEYELPYFVDAYGTRCALAHVIDRTGRADLVRRLAHDGNHDYVAFLEGDAALAAWLVRNGLTLDEAAFIQFPGTMMRDRRRGREPPRREPEPEPEPPPPPPPPHDAEVPGNEIVVPTPTAATRTRRGGAAGLGGWRAWWAANRDAFVCLRERYHGRQVRSTATLAVSTVARRPSEVVRERTLLPFLRETAQEKSELGGTALFMWTLAADPGTADGAVAGMRAYLARDDSGYRDLMLLALGFARDELATALLRDVLRDTAEGRRALRASRLRTTTRAYAAVALGNTGDPRAIDDLLAVLADEGDRRDDLRAAAVASAGRLAATAPPEARARVVAFLRERMEDGRWSDAALAAIPAALVATGDETARALVLETIARFRGKRIVRASCALALGQAYDGLDAAAVEALIATGRRDPDLQARRHAAIALGELAARDTSETPDEDVVRSVRRFFLGTLDGHLKSPGANEWYLLGAGLFARRFAGYAGDVTERLARALEHGTAEEKAAAAIALGLVGTPAARRAVAPALDAKDALLRGCAAEAAGLLDDTGARERLLALATEDPSDTVRYQAALALGYVADATAVTPLVDELGNSGSELTRAALTRALGEIGDRRAIAGLIALAGDARRPDALRERAVAALGIIGRRADRSWTLPLRRGVNVAAATPVLRDLLTIF